MTDEQRAREYATLAGEFWKVNKEHSAALAKAVFAECGLPSSAVIMIPNLAHLLSELQKRSFLLGAVAVLSTADARGETVQ